MNPKQYIDLLGYPVRDKVTGFRGVVTSVTFDLFGCIQAILVPPAEATDKLPEGAWFDIGRLERTGADRVMPLPDFHSGAGSQGLKGPAAKPPRALH